MCSIDVLSVYRTSASSHPCSNPYSSSYAILAIMMACFASVRTYSKRTLRELRMNRIKLAHVIGPCEFNFESTSSAVVTDATNLNVFHGPTFNLQRFDAMQTVTHPIPTASAPVEVTIHVR